MLISYWHLWQMLLPSNLSANKIPFFVSFLVKLRLCKESYKHQGNQKEEKQRQYRLIGSLKEHFFFSIWLTAVLDLQAYPLLMRPLKQRWPTSGTGVWAVMNLTTQQKVSDRQVREASLLSIVAPHYSPSPADGTI